MSDRELDYWKECISVAAEECQLTMTDEQLAYVAGAVQSSHENYGLAFYSPPSSDRYSELERQHRQEIEALKREMDKYRRNAERAIKEALGQPFDASVRIGDYGEVFRYDGRITQIQ